MDAAERFFFEGGDAASLVAGRRVALAHVLAYGVEMLLEAGRDLVNAVVHALVRRTARQNVLCADELRGLGENARAARRDDQIAHRADGRVGRQTARRVRTAAFRADDQLGDREFLSLEQARLGDHLLGVADRLLDGLERAARLLNDHALHGLAGALGDCLRDQIHLAVFAAERYEDRAVDIRVGRIARHDIHGKLLVDRDLRAALLIVEGYGAFDLLGNDACRIRGAHARGKDKYLVPHADAPVRTAIAVKCHIMLPFLLFSAPVFLHAHDVVNVNMRTGRNECCCLSDVLAVFYDRLALCDVANGELVVDGDVLRDRNGHRLAAQEKHRGLPCCDRFYGDSNVIFCINNHCICHFVIFLLSRSCSAGDVWVYVEERRSSILRSRAAVSGDCAALSGRMTAGKLLHAMM